MSATAVNMGVLTHRALEKEMQAAELLGFVADRAARLQVQIEAGNGINVLTRSLLQDDMRRVELLLTQAGALREGVALIGR